jgi:hypothetical protein
MDSDSERIESAEDEYVQKSIKTGQRVRLGRERGGLRVEIPHLKEREKIPIDDFPAGVPQKPFHLLQPQLSLN